MILVADLCNPNPCENNAICLQDGDENYKCICPYGYKGSNCQSKWQNKLMVHKGTIKALSKWRNWLNLL